MSYFTCLEGSGRLDLSYFTYLEGSRTLNLSYFTCLEGFKRLDLSYFTCLEDSGRLNVRILCVWKLKTSINTSHLLGFGDGKAPGCKINRILRVWKALGG